MGNQTPARTWGQFVYQYGDKIKSQYEDEKIISISIKSCRILHGSYSWLVNFSAKALTVGSSDPIEHWWLIIQTEYAYYVIQKYSNGIFMYRTTSSWKADQCGKKAAGKNEGADMWVQKYASINSYYETMGWFTRTLSQMDIGSYNLVMSNCQDFALRAFNTIAEGKPYNKRRSSTFVFFGFGTFTLERTN